MPLSIGPRSEVVVPPSRQRNAPPAAELSPPPPRTGWVPADRHAKITELRNAGARAQLALGKITVNGNTYDFKSGGHGKGNLPPGNYEVTPHLWSRSNKSMTIDGVGFSFALSNKYDPRVNATRQLLRIHPDGGSPGTIGCIGIQGNGEVQKRFREDMRQELQRTGGRFTLVVE